MKTYHVHLKSRSPYSQSKYYSDSKVPKLDKESPEAYERRTWRHRMHVDENGEVFISPMSLKNCLSDAAKFLSMKVPGKARATMTKHVEAGVMVIDPIKLGIKANEVEGEELFLPSDGRRGGGRRVVKIMPFIPSWEGATEIHVIDETVTESVLRKHLVEAGNLIGMGRFRPRNNGYYGRFAVVSLKLVESNSEAA